MDKISRISNDRGRVGDFFLGGRPPLGKASVNLMIRLAPARPSQGFSVGDGDR